MDRRTRELQSHGNHGLRHNKPVEISKESCSVSTQSDHLPRPVKEHLPRCYLPGFSTHTVLVMNIRELKSYRDLVLFEAVVL